MLEFLASLLDGFEVVVWFIAKAKAFGVVIAVVLLVIVALVVGALVGAVKRAFRRSTKQRS